MHHGKFVKIVHAFSFQLFILLELLLMLMTILLAQSFESSSNFVTDYKSYVHSFSVNKRTILPRKKSFSQNCNEMIVSFTIRST